MVDVASIVIAVISSLGTLLLGIAGFLYTRSSDDRKARSEAEKLISKYRDPLLLASHDLQSRLYNIADHNIAIWLYGTPDEKESLRLYTAFLVGQYLSWIYILRRQIQFLRFSTDKKEKNKDLGTILAKIASDFSSDNPEKGLSIAPFRLWRNQQMAIGEVMTVAEDKELYCMGSAAFFHRYKSGLKPEELEEELESNTTGTSSSSRTRSSYSIYAAGIPATEKELNGGVTQLTSQEFRNWFRPLIVGVNQICSAKLASRDHQQQQQEEEGVHRRRSRRRDDDDDDDHNNNNNTNTTGTDTNNNEHTPTQPAELDQRMRRLQHLLLDLMEILGLEYSGIGGENTSRCHRAYFCECSKCKNHDNICPCDEDRKPYCPYRFVEVYSRHPQIRERQRPRQRPRQRQSEMVEDGGEGRSYV